MLIRVSRAHRRSFFSSAQHGAVASVLSISLAACGGGGGGSGGGGTSGDDARLDLLLADAPADALVAFHATIDELWLVRDDGAETLDLMDAPVAVELLGLHASSAWIASAHVAPGTYTSARVRFAADSISATAKSGAAVPIRASDELLDVVLAAPLVLADGERDGVRIDLDLAESLAPDLAPSDPPVLDGAPAPLDGETSPPPLAFAPEGAAHATGAGALAIDELRGVYRGPGAAAGTLRIDASSGGESGAVLGVVLVTIESTALLLAEDGVALDEAQLLAELIPDRSLVEVHGELVAGGVRASQIEVEDLLGDGETSPVKIEGLVLAHEPGTGFELLLVHVEEGAEIVEPVLDALGDPSSIDLVYDPSTLFLRGDGSAAAEPDALEAGQRVKIKLAQFLALPFQASRVELEDLAPRCAATITDASGLPDEIVVRVAKGEAVLGNQVADESVDVRVDLSRTAVAIDTAGEPTLAPEELLANLAIELSGGFEGTPDAPSVRASSVRVRPGRLTGATVTSIDPASASFTVEGGTIARSFGGASDASLFRVRLHPHTAYEEEATSLAELYALFESLQPGQSIVVELEGLATSTPHALLALELETALVD